MKRVAIVAYDGCWAMSLMMIKDFFHVVALLEARQGLVATYQVEILSIDGLAKQSASGTQIDVDGHIMLDRIYDLVIIPSFEGKQLATLTLQSHDLVLWIRSLIQHEIAILALTTGVYFIAATKLADHMLLATHWAFIRELNCLFPSCSFTKNRNYLHAGSIYSTGTLMGTFDTLLGIIAQHKGDYFTQLCASHLLMTSPQLLNPVLPINFSERNLKRRFQLATQISPNQYLQQVRVDKAKKLLLTTDMNIQQIAYEVGYENVSFFIRIFKKVTACTPTQWVK